MAEPKRHETMTDLGMRWCDHGAWVRYDDYTTLSRELAQTKQAYADMVAEITASQAEFERLRKVEVAAQEYRQSMLEAIEEDKPEWQRLRRIEACAKELLRHAGEEFGHMDGTRLRAVHDADVAALAEACGREG